VPPTLTERSTRATPGSAAPRARGRATSRPRRAARRRADADVAAQLVDPPLETRLVERREVERAHLVPVGEQPPREVQAEEAGARRRSPRGHLDGSQ
jgi:hypothetical protein